MKKILAFCLLLSTISAKDTITFPMYEQPALYTHTYSYSYNDYDRDDDDRDGRSYNCPAVPEPSTYALFAGLFGLAFAMYKKRKN